MRILLIKLKHIGDTLIMTSAINSIKANYPNAVIDVIVREGTQSVLKDNTKINKILLAPRPEKHQRSLLREIVKTIKNFQFLCTHKYDYAIDLSNSSRNTLYALASFAKTRAINVSGYNLDYFQKLIFNKKISFPWSDLHQTQKDDLMCRIALDIETENPTPKMSIAQSAPNDFIESNKLLENKYIFAHITSRWKHKEWEKERWREVFGYINSLGYRIVLSSGPEKSEREYVEYFVRKGLDVILTDGTLSFQENAFLIEKAALFIGVDTAMMHVASTTDTFIIALFGVSDEWAWRPWCENHKLIMKECKCKRERKILCDKSNIVECMDKIEVNEVNKIIGEIVNV